MTHTFNRGFLLGWLLLMLGACTQTTPHVLSSLTSLCSSNPRLKVLKVTNYLDMQDIALSIDGSRISMQASTQLDRADGVSAHDLESTSNRAHRFAPKDFPRNYIGNAVYALNGTAGGKTIVRFKVDASQDASDISQVGESLLKCDPSGL